MDSGARHPAMSVGVASTAELAERVRDAAARGRRLRISSGGGWLDAGRPVDDASLLSLEPLHGIVEYVPGDVTLTARAGTTLGEIERVTAREGQFLALDPFGRPTATLGATIATASAGPLAHAFGTPRDLVLGLEAVTGDGRAIRAGGRVVKNVAGFDLTRMLTGAWGTLGVITEVSVRLRARPEVEETIAIHSTREVTNESISDLLEELRGCAVSPWALELLSPALAARLGVASRTAAIARLAGNEGSVRAQRAAFSALAPVTSTSDAVWGALRQSEGADAAVIRLSRRPSQVGATWVAARRATASWSGAYAHASLGRGIVRLILPGADAARTTALLDLLSAAKVTIIGERLPAPCWSHRAIASGVRDPLSRRAREAFDPARILNPGILGEEG